jgi:sterol desaturase/sphingolipid hydroxylase (fatty acid hydroxylase superfamily)
MLIFALSFLLIDLLTYASHRISHSASVLWRFHKIHHADEHVTAISAFLHHPLENIINFVIMLLICVIVGIPILALVIYGFVASAHNAFSHANISLPKWLDDLLRMIFVTPDVHRTHHSVLQAEGNSNFGQIFSIWDRLLGTYLAKPSVPETALVMGLPPSEKPDYFAVLSLLAVPFKARRTP